MRNAVRLAVGTLTVLPVRPPDRVDDRTSAQAMVLAPTVGLVLGGLAALVVGAAGDTPLLAAALTVALAALATRGLHLDGLADTADGLGSGKPATDALALMRRGDVGPFGVATLTVVLLVQVAAVATATDQDRGAFTVVAAFVVSRFVLPLLCLRGIPAARVDGLGSAVAGTVGPGMLLVAGLTTVLGLVVALVVPAAFGAPVHDAMGVGVGAWTRVTVALALSLLAAGALARRCVRRLGGITGDVLGACVEVAFTVVVVVLALG